MRHKVKCITINTDASWHPVHKCGGWAFWIVFDGTRIKRSGQFRQNPTSSTHAEMMAIGNAFAFLTSYPNLPECEWLILNTDCIAARKAIKQRSGDLGEHVNNLWQKAIRAANSKKNKIRHVRGHTGKQDARSIVNDWCDTEAKMHMRALVKYQEVKPLIEDRFSH